MPKGLKTASQNFAASSASDMARHKAIVAHQDTPLTVVADNSQRVIIDNGAIDYGQGNADLSYYTYVDGNGNDNGLVDILYFQFNEVVPEGRYYGLVNGEEAAFFVMGGSTAYVITDETVATTASAATWNASFDAGGTSYAFSYSYAPPPGVSPDWIV